MQRATPRVDCGYCAQHLARSNSSRSICATAATALITETEAWHDYRFRAEECTRLLRALRIPRVVVLRNGSTFHEETALLLLSRRMRKALLCL